MYYKCTSSLCVVTQLTNLVTFYIWNNIISGKFSFEIFLLSQCSYKSIALETCLSLKFSATVPQLTLCQTFEALSEHPQAWMDMSKPDQFVQVRSGNLTIKYMVHTLFDVLGHYHEHQWSDRDQYTSLLRGCCLSSIVAHMYSLLC